MVLSKLYLAVGFFAALYPLIEGTPITLGQPMSLDPRNTPHRCPNANRCFAHCWPDDCGKFGVSAGREHKQERIGTISIDKITDLLHAHCLRESGNEGRCDGGTYDLDTKVLVDGSLNDATLKVTLGDNKFNYAHKQDLIDSMTRFMKVTAKTNKESYRKTECPFEHQDSVVVDDPPTQVERDAPTPVENIGQSHPTCSEVTKHSTQTKLAHSYSIDSKGGGNMLVTMDVHVESGDACSDIVGSFGAAAGAISGPVSAVFSLAELFCN